MEPAHQRERKLQALASAFDVGLRILAAAMALVILRQALVSAVFIVPQHEAAFVLRFGRIAGVAAGRIKQPGLHIAMPYPIDEVVSVPVGRVRSVVSDAFWHAGGTNEFGATWASGPTLSPERDGYTLTADVNILHSRWVCRYRIRAPERFAFGVKEMDTLVRHELERAVTLACALHTVDAIIRADTAFRDSVAGILARRCAELELGVEIEGVELSALSPPLQTMEAFEGVLRAEQQKAGEIHSARSYATKAVNEAAGKAAEVVSRAVAERERFTSVLRAEAEYFEGMVAKDAQAPASLRSILLQEALLRALSAAGEKYILRAPAGGTASELRLLLAPEPKRPMSIGTRP